MKVVIWSPLNTSGFNTDLEKNKDWLNRRIEILNKYVIPSLNYQVDKDFLWFLEVREDTTDIIVPKLDFLDVPVVICERPVVHDWKLGKGLAWERQTKDIKKHITDKVFYDVRLNSDDLYRKDFVRDLKKIKTKKGTQAIIPRNGYLWYVAPDVVVQRNHYSPPFHAFIYNTQKYLDGLRYKTRKGHVGVRKLNHVVMPDRYWCWLVHDVNQKIIRKGGYPSYNKYPIVEHEVLNDFLPTQNQR